MGKKLKLYFDEIGDCKVGDKTSPLFIVAASAVASGLCKPGEVERLEDQLSGLGYSGMIHTAQLVRKSGEYANMELWRRREIFWALYRYIISGGVQVRTILVDKRGLADDSQLYAQVASQLDITISELINLSKRHSVQINYDGGQRQLQRILEGAVSNIDGAEYQADFDPRSERAFQASDLATYVRRLIFQQEQRVPLNKSDTMFFTADDLKLFRKHLQNGWKLK